MIFGLLFIAVALVVLLLGMAIAALLLFGAGLLLALGILSVSAIVGLLSGSARAAVRTLLMFGAALVGAPLGVFLAWLLTSWFQVGTIGTTAFLYGALGGVAAGVVLVLLFERVAQRLYGLAVTCGSRVEHAGNLV